MMKEPSGSNALLLENQTSARSGLGPKRRLLLSPLPSPPFTPLSPLPSPLLLLCLISHLPLYSSVSSLLLFHLPPLISPLISPFVSPFLSSPPLSPSFILLRCTFVLFSSSSFFLFLSLSYRLFSLLSPISLSHLLLSYFLSSSSPSPLSSCLRSFKACGLLSTLITDVYATLSLFTQLLCAQAVSVSVCTCVHVCVHTCVCVCVCVCMCVCAGVPC